MVWTSPSLHLYWTSFFKTISEAVDRPLDPCPLATLFGILPEEVKMSKLKEDFVAFVTLTVRRSLLLFWKKPSAPTHGEGSVAALLTRIN